MLQELELILWSDEKKYRILATNTQGGFSVWKWTGYMEKDNG